MLYLQVADSQKRADVAASLVVIDYDTNNLVSPILSVEEAVERSSLFEVPSYLRSQPVGDITKGMAEAEHKILGSKVVSFKTYIYIYVSQAPALV